MDEITVDKSELLAKLEENREHHVNTFEQVLEDYRNHAVDLLNDHIERIRKGAVESVLVHLPEPKNYEKEYDRVIAMIQWEKADEINLTLRDFQRFVLDEWDWRRDFDQTVATYSAG